MNKPTFRTLFCVLGDFSFLSATMDDFPAKQGLLVVSVPGLSQNGRM